MSKIIDEMRKEYRIYKVVKIAHELIEEYEKNNPTKFKNSGYDSWNPASSKVKEEFLKRRGITTQIANRTLAAAIKENYLIPKTQMHGNIKLDTVYVSPDKGDDILNDVPYLPFIKIGLLEAIWEKHGVFLSGVVIGIFLPILLTCAKSLYEFIMERV